MIKNLLGKILLPIFLVAILLLFFYVVSQSQPIQNQPASLLSATTSLLGTPVILPPTETRTLNCVPYPSTNKPNYTSTATPYPGQQKGSPNFITPTPRPIAHTFDLSPDSQEIDKRIILVFRCDGTYDQFIVGPGIKIPQDLHLGIGDTIFDSYPVIMNIRPLPPPPTLTAIPTVTTNAFTTSTPINPTMVPYPYPSRYP